MTSHDVVAVARRRLGIRRVGHAGTLDPLAEGVLVLLLGRATRVAEYVTGHDKEYRAALLLGIATDTQDVEGNITAEESASGITSEDLSRALESFRGTLMQVPPMYSAVKIDGKRLYRLARQGETVERKPRQVTVRESELISFTPGERARASLRFVVSAGCYIRTLCHDIGAVLGVGGCMESLVRTASGPFRLEDAVPLEAVERGSTAEVRARILPPAAALDGYPRIDLDAGGAERFCHGGSIDGEPARAADERPDRLVRVHGAAGQLLGIGQVDALSEHIRPMKVICDP